MPDLYTGPDGRSTAGERRSATGARTYTRPVPVLLAALGALVMSLDSAANIAFPAMAAAFGVGPSEIRWVIVCYVFAYAVTSFAAGVAADRLGPRPVFVTGLGLSALAFAAYPLAAAFPTVLAIRVLQGVGDAFGAGAVGF